MTPKPAESAVERHGHWCGFCQTHHSSVSCFHPSNPARYVHSETGHGSATGVNEPGVMTAYVEDWRERAMQAEAKLAALEAEVERLKTGHCEDCCCAQSWKALSVHEFDGKSIPEHISDLKQRAEAAEAKVLQLGIEKDAEEYRANVAEAEVKKAWSERDHYLNAVMERNTELRKVKAEVELRDRMLVAEYDSPTPKTAGHMRWFADLRARAGSDA